MKVLLQVAVLSTSFLLLSCEKTEVNKIAEAQACMDAATSGAEATECVVKVEGLEGPAASRIRLGAVYIQRNVTNAKFVSAYNSLKNPPPATNGTMAVFVTLGFTGVNTFRGSATAAQDSDYVVAEALKTGSGGLYWLATGSKVGTLINAVAATPGVPATITAGEIASIPSADVGAIAIQTYNLYCNNTSASSSASCTDINAAIASGGTDPTAVGCKLKQLLGGNNVCP